MQDVSGKDLDARDKPGMTDLDASIANTNCFMAFCGLAVAPQGDVIAGYDCSMGGVVCSVVTRQSVGSG
jgi:hypothetical protein